MLPETARIVYARSDFPHPFQFSFSSVFPKKARIRLCKTDPDPIWMAWSGFGQTHLVWKQAGVQESSGPVSQFQNRLRSSTDVPDNTVQNQPESELVLADCVRFGPNGSGPEASQCARIIRPASGQCFPADPDRMRIGSNIFTGLQGLCFRPGRPKSPLTATAPGHILRLGIVHHVELPSFMNTNAVRCDIRLNCVCVRAYVRACVRACVCVCVLEMMRKTLSEVLQCSLLVL